MAAEAKKRAVELTLAEKVKKKEEYEAKGGMFFGFGKKASVEKKVKISAPVTQQEISKVKFSERHKLTDPENYGDDVGEDQPHIPSAADSALLHIEPLQVLERGEVRSEGGEEQSDAVALLGDADANESDPNGMPYSYGALDESGSPGDGPAEQWALEGRPLGGFQAQDDESAIVSLDPSLRTGGNELYSLADRTVTDDSMTLAGYTEARHITLQFLSAEGLPTDLGAADTQWVVRFNGFKAAEVGGRLQYMSSAERAEKERAERGEGAELEGTEALITESPHEEEEWEREERELRKTLQPPEEAQDQKDENQMRQRRLDLAATVEFPGSAVVDMYVPPFLELASCSVEIELWATRTVRGEPEHMLCGAVDIRGSRLVSFIESRGFESSWLTLYDLEGAPVSSLNSFGDLVPMRVQLRGDSPAPEGPKVLKLNLSLHSVRNLWFSREAAPYGSRKTDTDSELGSKKSTKSDRSGKSDKSDDKASAPPTSLYIEVRFNDSTVGSTPPMPDSFEPFPAWTATGKFEIMVPSELTLEQCRLELRLFSAVIPKVKKGTKKKKGTTTFLGAKLLEGQALRDFFDGVPGPVLDSPLQKQISAVAGESQISPRDNEDNEEVEEIVALQNLQAGALTAYKTMLYSLHPSPLLAQSDDPAAKVKIAPEEDMRQTVMEMRGQAQWVAEEDWEMGNEPGSAEAAVEALPSAGGQGEEGAFYDPRPSSAEMMRRIAGMDYIPAGQGAPSPFGELPNSIISGAMVERPWSRLSRASIGRDIPEGQRANAMADVQDMSETKLLLTLHEVSFEAAAISLRATQRSVTARIFFNERCVGERIVRLEQRVAEVEQKEEKDAKAKSSLSGRKSEGKEGKEGEAEEEEEEDQPSPSNLGPSTIVLFVPRGQRLDSCTLEVELLHKGAPVGYISVNSPELVQLMVLPAVESVEAAVLQRQEQLERELMSGGKWKAATAVPESASALAGSLASGSVSVGAQPPAVAPAKDSALPSAELNVAASYTIIATHGKNPEALAAVGSAKLSGSAAPLDSAWEEARQRLSMGAAMHRRGADDTQRRVQVKLLACQGLSGSLKSMHSPRVNGVAAYSSYERTHAGADEAASPYAGHGTGGAPQSPNSSPTSHSSSRHPSQKTNKTVFAVIKWNGQEIRRSEKVVPGNDLVFKHHAPESYSRESKAKTPRPSACTNTFTMMVPRGHRLRGCYLEVVLWDAEVCLGSTLLHGEDLTMFLEGYGSSPADLDFYSFYDPEDEIAQGHRSFPLQYSASVPQAMQAAVHGRIVLRGRVDPDPDPLARAAVQPRGGVLDCPYPKIRTSLAPEALGWRHSFEDPVGGEDNMLGSALEGSSVVGMQTVESAADGTSQKRRKRGGTESGRQPLGFRFYAPMPGPLEGFAESVNTDEVRSLFLTKFRCEMAAVTFLKFRSKTAQEDRVCWRGRGMPAEVKGLTDAQKGDMFKNRSSRCVRRGSISELRVLVDLTFLQEVSGEENAMSAALPIVVKEIVSDGPGISQRIYRIEITTNVGASLGIVDILNDLEIIRAVGAEHVAIFGDRGRLGWSLPDIFGHIVNKRTNLDFAPPKRRKQEPPKPQAGGLMGMMFKKKDVVADAPKSVISVMRDEELSEEVVRFAMQGGTLGGLTLEQQEAQRREEEAEKKAEEKRKLFRKALEKKKKERLAVPPTPEELEQHRLEREMWAEQRVENGRARKERKLNRGKKGTSSTGRGSSSVGRDSSPSQRKSFDPEDAPSSGPPSPAPSSPPPRSSSPGRFGMSLGGITSGTASLFSSAKSMLGISESPVQVAEEAPDVIIAPRERRLRIHNLAHNMSGIKFRTVVLLCGTVTILESDPDEYFLGGGVVSTLNVAQQRACLLPLRLIIKAKDAYTAKVFELEFSGAEILQFIGHNYPLDLRKKFRRLKFGEFLVSKMIMRFDSSGGYILDLMSDDMGSVKSEAAVADKLRRLKEAADEEKRLQEEELDRALVEALRADRRRRWYAENGDSSEEEEEEEVGEDTRQSMFGNSMAGAGAAAAEAMRKTAEAASNALKGMFSWGKKKE